MPTWTPERTLDAQLAAALVEEQFPQLALARAELLGAGWDNTAFLVNGAWVFRFPRRTIAVELLQREARLLPLIAPHLPLPVPLPELAGSATSKFPWPFLGHRLLPGRMALGLSDDERLGFAEPLGRFVAALHALDLPPWLPRDLFGRIPATPDRPVLVHGDLHARQLLLPLAVIDWGDAHAGHPDVDLSLGFSFFHGEARELFFAAYGAQPGPYARRRALHVSKRLHEYALDTGDAALQREAVIALDNASDSSRDKGAP